MLTKKGSLVNNSYIFEPTLILSTLFRSAVCSLGKFTTNPIKHQASIVDETWAILKNSINFQRKMPMKKGSLVNNSNIFEPRLILSTLFRSAVCSLGKFTTNPIKHQASIVDETWANLKNSINFHTKIPIKKWSIVNNTYIFLTDFESDNVVMLCSMVSCQTQKFRRIR